MSLKISFEKLFFIPEVTERTALMKRQRGEKTSTVVFIVVLDKAFHTGLRWANNNATGYNKCLDLGTCDHSVGFVSQRRHTAILVGSVNLTRCAV